MHALLIIDTQIGLVTGAYNEDKIIDAINTAIKFTRKHNGIIVLIQHCHKSYAPLQKGAVTWQIDPRVNTSERARHNH